MYETDPEEPTPLPAADLPAAPAFSQSADPIFSRPEPPQPTVHRFFFGDDGLRAGWSFGLFLILLVALIFLFSFLLVRFHLLVLPSKNAAAQPMSSTFTTLSDGSQFLAAALAAWVMSLIERRPWSRYGITMQRALPDFFAGLFWGFFCLSTLIGLLFVTHSIAFDGLALHGAYAATSGAKWLLGFLFVGLSEEFITRGYIQYTVSRGVAGITRAMDPQNRYSHVIGFWVAAFLFSALLFMTAHLGNTGETFWGIMQVGFAGAVFAFSLWRTGSLWWAIGFHCSWDWAQSYFYGTHDSGLAAVGHLLNSHPTGNRCSPAATPARRAASSAPRSSC